MEPSSDLSHEKGDSREHGDWDRLLADAAPRDHVVQLYQDQDFLNRAVCRFAAAALANGEGVILVPTVKHWNAFRPRLIAEGVEVEAAQKHGQLTSSMPMKLCPASCTMRCRIRQCSWAWRRMSSRAPGAGSRFPKVRWWGEMVNILWERGDVAASMNLEDLFDQLAQKHDIAIFCSFLMDNFNGEIHTRLLPRLGENHSHLIPVEDYARLERAVADALRDTVGPDEARVLESELLSRYPAKFNMPRPQALLLALRQVLPTVSDSVLQRCGKLYSSDVANR